MDKGYVESGVNAGPTLGSRLGVPPGGPGSRFPLFWFALSFYGILKFS